MNEQSEVFTVLSTNIFVLYSHHRECRFPSSRPCFWSFGWHWCIPHLTRFQKCVGFTRWEWLLNLLNHNICFHTTMLLFQYFFMWNRYLWITVSCNGDEISKLLEVHASWFDGRGKVTWLFTTIVKHERQVAACVFLSHVVANKINLIKINLLMNQSETYQPTNMLFSI